MFLDRTIERNPKLINLAMRYISEGVIEPDTYLIDLDSLLSNAKKLIDMAKEFDIKLYFMTKQIGRNPYIGKKLMELGYEGAVCVDYREALKLGKNGVKIGHVGHLVQIPKNMIEKILELKPNIITVYSLKKAIEISEVATRLNINVQLMIRVIHEEDRIYEGQKGGIELESLEIIAKKIDSLKNVSVTGITTFPCFLYNSNTDKIEKTRNIDTINKALEILKKIGINIEQINMPSNTSLATIKMLKENGATHGEPGHSLTGTTPQLAKHSSGEKPSIIYASEISHSLKSNSYFYGGGHYRRSHIDKVLVGNSCENSIRADVLPLLPTCIDYYFEINKVCKVSEPVIAAFRTQIFVTRSRVALVEGLSNNSPKIQGIYDSSGTKLRV